MDSYPVSTITVVVISVCFLSLLGGAAIAADTPETIDNTHTTAQTEEINSEAIVNSQLFLTNQGNDTSPGHTDAEIIQNGDGDSSRGDPDHFTEIQIYVDENGDAEFRIIHGVELYDLDDQDRYEDFIDRYNDDADRHAEQFEARFSPVVDAANDSTDREMTIQNVDTHSYIHLTNRGDDEETDTHLGDIRTNAHHRLGIVEYRFEWTNFAKETNYGYEIGDAFHGPITFDEDTKLVILYPENADTGLVAPEPGFSVVSELRWDQGQQFAPGEPTAQIVTDDNDGVDNEFEILSDVLFAITILTSSLFAIIGGFFILRRYIDTS